MKIKIIKFNVKSMPLAEQLKNQMPSENATRHFESLGHNQMPFSPKFQLIYFV